MVQLTEYYMYKIKTIPAKDTFALLEFILE